MTDEARIARLTELARRVWPASTVTVHNEGEWAWVVREDTHSTSTRLHMQHPRALDALEAALLVLADEVTLREVERAGLPQSGPWPQLRQAEEKLARLEQLAKEWEGSMNAHKRRCGAELRMRACAKGEPCE